MNKKIFAALISVLMVCAVLPVLPVSAVNHTRGLVLTDDTQGLYTTGNNLPFPNDGSWSWDNDTNTLTLMNFEFITSYHAALETLDHMQITINVPYGESTISSENFSGAGYVPWGIYSPSGTVSFTGSGTLNVLSGTSTNNPGASIAIDAKAVNCDELTLNATAGDATNGNSYGIRCQDLTVNSGLVNATGGTPGKSYNNVSCGINVENLDTFTLNGGEVRATGGSYEDEGNSISIGLQTAGAPIIKGGKLIATGGDVVGPDNASCGIVSSGLDMESGEVIAAGGSSAVISYGIFTTDEIIVHAAVNSAIFKGHYSAVFLDDDGALSVEAQYKYKSDNYDGSDGIEVEGFDSPELAKYIELRGSAYPVSEPAKPEPKPIDAPYYSNTPPPSPPYVTLSLIEYIDNEAVGSIKTSRRFSAYVRIDSKRTAQTEEYIADRWNIEALGSFETAQRGGWGDIVTLSVNLEDLGFEAENGTKLYVLIFDTKTKEWHRNEAIIMNGNIVIVTEHSGIFAIVNEKVL